MLKRLLFVAIPLEDSQALRQVLVADPSADWQVSQAPDGAAAMAAIQAEPLDVIVTEFTMPDMNGALLLNWVSEHSPQTLRVIMARASEREEVMKWVLGQHHFLAKPVPPELLKSTIQRAMALDSWLFNDQLKELVSRIRTFPSLPTLYFQVMKELDSPDFSAERVGEIIGKDLAMTTKLLQVLNSGFYGLARQITDPAEAVSLLGQEIVKSLIISIHIFSQTDQVKPLYYSISRIWRHSTQMANAARLIVQAETQDAELAGEAYAAGLLHDIGKLVLANNFEEQYLQTQNRANRARKPLWQVEEEFFGISHAELGAYLLGRWGMPVSLMEATALHHRPSRGASKTFSVLTAVHVANALDQELHPEPEGFVPETLDQSYLKELGLTHRVEVWRRVLTAGAMAEPPVGAKHPVLAAPKRPIRLNNQGLPAYFKWAAGVGLALLAGAVIWTFWPSPVQQKPAATLPVESVASPTPATNDPIMETAPEVAAGTNAPAESTNLPPSTNLLQEPLAPAETNGTNRPE